MHASGLPAHGEVARASHEYLYGEPRLPETLARFEQAAARAETASLPPRLQAAVRRVLETIRQLRVRPEESRLPEQLRAAVEGLGLDHEQKLARAVARADEALPLPPEAPAEPRAAAAPVESAAARESAPRSPADAATLLRYAQRCGVSASLRALRDQGMAMVRLVTHTDPAEQLAAVAHYCLGRRSCNVVGAHFFSFGGSARTAEWMNRSIVGHG